MTTLTPPTRPAAGEDSTFDFEVPYSWASDLDEHITALRVTDPRLDAAFALAERGGTAVLPTWTERDGSRAQSPLLFLSRNGGDEDYLVITRAREAEFDMVVEAGDSIAERLAPSGVEWHETPSWSIRFTYHS